MDNTLMTIIGIFLAITLIFVIPLMSITQRNDDVTQTVIQTATEEFVDKISVSGAIKPTDYEEYIQKLNSTGNLYDVEIEVQHLDENFGKKNGTTTKDLIGENERYSTFTSEILENMYLEDGSSENYLLKKGDNIIVTAKNTNRTMAQTLRTFIYKVTGQGTYEIVAISSEMVVNNGGGKYVIGQEKSEEPLVPEEPTIPEEPLVPEEPIIPEEPDVPEETIPEKLYLYNQGNEYTDITGGWYPTIYSDWGLPDANAALFYGATYSKTNNRLSFGDDKNNSYGNGAFATADKIEEIIKYKKLVVKYKVTQSTQSNEYDNVFWVAFTGKKTRFITHNSNYTYKESFPNEPNKETVVKTYNEMYNEFGEYIENGVRRTRTIYDYVDLLKTKENLWKSKEIGVEQTATIELNDNDISKMTNNNGCYIIINGSCHANQTGTMNVEVYEIYLTNN